MAPFNFFQNGIEKVKGMFSCWLHKVMNEKKTLNTKLRRKIETQKELSHCILETKADNKK